MDVSLECLLVVYDDVNLPFGQLRLRAKGSDGGHKGMASIIAHLGSDQFPRLRIGIGSEFRQGQIVGHVLSKFNRNEKKELHNILAQAVEAIDTFNSDGIEIAMNKFN